MSPQITDAIIRFIEIAITLYGYKAYEKWLERREEKKIKITTDYSSDYDKKAKINPILEDIKYELDADRVQYWEFSNGEKTLSGHHLKKLSLFMESNKEGLKELAPQFQAVPVKKFERGLDKLYESSDDFVYSNEMLEFDELGSLNAQFNIASTLSIKIKNEIGVWVGVLIICFETVRPLNEGEIAFAKVQASRISVIK
jgi:hypothetical protein